TGADIATDGAVADCRAKLAGLRANECVLFAAPDNGFFTARSFGGVWDATAVGWKGLDFFETGDGITFPVLFRKTEGGMGLRLIGQTTTWYATEIRCAGGATEFAVPYCPPDSLDGSGVDSDPAGDCADLAGCEDHTFRVRVSCATCDADPGGATRARVTACATFGATPVTLYVTITAVTGTCNAALVGVTVPVYYTAASGYIPLQTDVDALGIACLASGGYGGAPLGVGMGYLFQLTGCNIYGFAANGYDGVSPPTSTDPFVFEGTWSKPTGADPCCLGGFGGTIDFTVSEDAP
ncbi:MAG: hypothetical protein U0871_00015, partial [Gemmataceae bacterium]